ncbi:hypothetical protein M2D88_27795, partial [Klebsiella pneumoniae]|nr:hypothetical protein [Klebsiella pneumoniae]MDZ3387108.1 hypothetical protein [Klebsiella pneumoniae]MDZ3462711.1 hypothetical protein [Klebsiella pneumoniae]
PQNDVTLKMPAFEWVHVQLHQQKGMISLSPPTICNSALLLKKMVILKKEKAFTHMLNVVSHP